MKKKSFHISGWALKLISWENLPLLDCAGDDIYYGMCFHNEKHKLNLHLRGSVLV